MESGGRGTEMVGWVFIASVVGAQMPGLSGSNLADIVPSRTPSAIVRNITNGRGEVPLHRPVPFSELYCLYGLGVLIPIHHRPMKTNRPLHFVGRYSNGRRQGKEYHGLRPVKHSVYVGRRVWWRIRAIYAFASKTRRF